MIKKIILIEDDQDTCLLFKHVLSKAGYEVRHYFDGRFIFNTEYEVPDLYILDNCLPSIDGVALTKHLKLQNNHHNIPILIVSGNRTIRNRTRDAGASGFVSKP